MTVIELGELRHGDEAEPPPRSGGRSARWPRVAALFAVALLTLAGAAPAPARVRPVSVPAPQGAIFLLLGDRLVVADGPGNVGNGGRLVTGHRLPGGEPLWRFSLPAGDHVLGLTAVAGGLLVTSSPAGAGDPASTLLDVNSGAVRWRRAGYPVRARSGAVLLETPRADGTGTVRAVDPATGATRWSLPMPANGVAYRVDDRGVTQLVLVTAAGRVAVHDVGTGALLRSGRVPPAPDGVAYRFAQVVGDLLLVDGASGGVTAYGLDRLDRRWSVPVRSEAQGFEDCAGVVCQRDQATGLRALDPVTGRPLWTDDRLVGTVPAGGRLLTAELAAGAELDLTVRDPTTGRVVGRLGRWRVPRVQWSGGPLLGLRRLPGDRVLVAELDVPAGRTRIRTVLPGSWDDCAAGRTVLVCLRASGGLVVWRG
ncbi:PQQ-binding-like beta-propeller repeat protein [Micromonospora mangrovi]|uniref:PQQ-binding-like beta-propeller repeat protein n=2 Tax=Micromonospora TaxID=1873 RepID=A0AAU8H5N7_9ACTN